MLRLIYEKSSSIKIKILKLAIKKGGQIHKYELLKKLHISASTLNKYLLEIEQELPIDSVFMSNQSIFFDIKTCSLLDVQKIYLSNSVVKDILYSCFFQKNLSLEALSRDLFISPSKMLNILNYLDEQFKEIGVSIQRRPYIILKGSPESIMILYNIYLQTEDYPAKTSFMKVDYYKIKKAVIQFLEYYNLEIEKFIVKDLCIWLITIGDRFFLANKKKYDKYHIFMDKNSKVLKKIREQFSFINRDAFDYDGCMLALVFMIFNLTSLHFKNDKWEKIFFRNEIKREFNYQQLMDKFFQKRAYNIPKEYLEIFTLKVEAIIYYNKVIFPYYYFYKTLLIPKLEESLVLKKIIIDLNQNFTLTEKDSSTVNWICELVAFTLLGFQDFYVDEEIFNIGVYSVRGTRFEKKFSNKIKNSINIAPYYQLKNSADILIIDDIELLSSVDNYYKYIVVGDGSLNEIKKLKNNLLKNIGGNNARL